jgi:hypothetical protein
MEILGWLLIERFIEIFEWFIFEWSVHLRMSLVGLSTFDGQGHELIENGCRLSAPDQYLWGTGPLFEGY